MNVDGDRSRMVMKKEQDVSPRLQESTESSTAC
jgi:hypothetical protein